MVKISMLTISTSSFIVSFMGFANTAVSPQTDEQWRTVIENDIQAAYNITAQYHPGMFDANNPAFPDLLKQAKAQALKLSTQASGPQVHVAAIARFSTVLQDGHAGVFSSVERPARRWPGFSAVWRGDAL